MGMEPLSEDTLGSAVICSVSDWLSMAGNTEHNPQSSIRFHDNQEWPSCIGTRAQEEAALACMAPCVHVCAQTCTLMGAVVRVLLGDGAVPPQRSLGDAVFPQQVALTVGLGGE